MKYNPMGEFILTMIKAKYIGEDDIDLRHGETYEVCKISDDNRFLGVKDRSGEVYAYSKELFEIVENED